VSQTYSRQEVSYLGALRRHDESCKEKSQTAKHIRHLLQEKNMKFLHVSASLSKSLVAAPGLNKMKPLLPGHLGP
jgi:hypothetical protein